MDKIGETISNVTAPAMDAMGRAGETLKQTGSSQGETGNRPSQPNQPKPGQPTPTV